MKDMQCELGDIHTCRGFLGDSDSKESAHSAGNPASIPGSGRDRQKRGWQPTPYSYLENYVDKGV